FVSCHVLGMKITIDVRHLLLGLLCIGSSAATPPTFTSPPPPPPADPSYPVSNPGVPTVTRWDFKCVDWETAGVPQNWANHDLDKPDGWNPYLARMAAGGWEPTTFIAPNGIIHAVCFRRVAVVKPPPAPYVPTPLGPQGRCSAAEIAEMAKSGMSESAI